MPTARNVRVSKSGGDSAVEAIRRIADACEDADGRSPLNDQARLDLADRGLEAATLHLAGEQGFALERGGELVLAVTPEHRGSGVGAALLAAAEAASSAWSFGDHPAARALASRSGWAPKRTLLQLARPAGSPPLSSATTQANLRAFQPTDEAAVLAANAEAFAHHPEQASLSSAGFRQRLAEPGLGPEGLFVAEVDHKVVGFHWTKVHSDGRGEVYVIGLADAAQGKGLGKALLNHGLEHLREATGDAEVLLYVDADNESAVALYEKSGFELATSDVQYARATHRSPSGDTMAP